jgi:TonB family protein
MKICPKCSATYDYDMSFCLNDGTALQILNPGQQTTEKSDEKTLVLPNAAPASQPTVLQSPPSETWQNPVNQQTLNQTQNPTVQQRPETQSAPRKSNTGLMLGTVAAALALIGIAVGGGWWYLKDREKENLVLTDANKSRREIVFDNNSNVNTSNVNAAEIFDDDSNIKPLANYDAKPSPTASGTSKTTPTPENKPTPQIETPTKPTPRNEIQTEMPPAPTPPPTRLPTPQTNVPKSVSLGVMNGKATRLVTPPYPPAAKAVHASGAVNVSVSLDENGNVVSANAVSGHPLLRQAAEQAARASKFSPTVLSGQPVKVTGIIVYNFIAQ